MAEAVRINSSIYQLDDGTAHIIIGMRMKQKALQWFHSKPEHLEITVEELLEKMKVIFEASLITDPRKWICGSSSRKNSGEVTRHLVTFIQYL